MNILELAILKKMVGGGGGSGTDNYNDLSNLPQINGETLAGNKTAENLGLQDALTFDSTPTENSTNPVESGGVYNALAGKQDNLTFDDDPTENSTNPVKSGGVYSALAGKQDNLTFDGVYNASTNKAATESTVTNAIAGLDVSAFSVDADETISSISETDGKVSITKQDIAIASNQVVAMTGYTKPSSAPATPAIQQGDTANAAIGKLEYKADVNQSNILSVASQNPISVYSLDSKSMTGAGYLVAENTPVKMPKGNYNIAYTSDKAISIVLVVGNGNTEIHRESMTCAIGANSFNFTTTTNGDNIRVYVSESCEIDNLCIVPKVYRDCGYTDYVYALPNYDLTVREAEDRAALAEQVDEGAKNLLDTVEGTFTSGNATVVCGTDKTVALTVSGDISTNASFVLFKSGVFVPNTYAGCIVSGAPSGSDESFAIAVSYSNNGSSQANVVFIKSNEYHQISSSYAYIGVFVYVFAGAPTVNNLIFKPMICTEADWKVSQKFEPYALPNYDLTVLESEDRAALVEVIDKGAKNILPDLRNLGASAYNTTMSMDEKSVSVAASGDYGYGTLVYQNLKVGNYVCSCNIKSRTGSSITKIAVRSNSVMGVDLGANEFTTNGKIYFSFNVTEQTDLYILFYGAFGGFINETSYIADDVMICTEADWKISQNYAPFALPNTDLTQLVKTKAPALSTNTAIDSGSLDDVAENTFAVYASTVTNVPTSDDYYVETIVYDASNALQKAYNYTDGTSYVRVKNTATWGNWKQITNA